MPKISVPEINLLSAALPTKRIIVDVAGSFNSQKFVLVKFMKEMHTESLSLLVASVASLTLKE